MKSIKKMIWPLCEFTLRKSGLLPFYRLALYGYLRKVGWFDSFRTGMPVDFAGNPLPWMTYAAIMFLKQRVKPEFRVFEYSCGNSTLWWADRVEKIISCEHDLEWFERMKIRVPVNVELNHIALEYGGEYSRKIGEYDNKFDVIVIDGRDRVNCAKNCLPALKDQGIVLWDNSDRDEYREGYQYLLANGFRRLDFGGMGPVNVEDWCTSIFYRKENCLGI